MAVRKESYLITGEVVFGQNFFRAFERGIESLRAAGSKSFSREAGKRLAKAFSSSDMKVDIQFSGKNSGIEAAADALESWKEGEFGPGGLLEDEVGSRMENILDNVAQRYFSAGIGSRTGALADAMDSQSVVVDSNKSRIIGAVFNWRALESATTRNAVLAGARGRAGVKKYNYPTPDRDISIAGYWAFMDQGFTQWRTGDYVDGREFIFQMFGEYNPEDLEQLDMIPEHLNESVEELNKATRAVVR